MKKFSRTTVLVRFYLPIRLFHELVANKNLLCEMSSNIAYKNENSISFNWFTIIIAKRYEFKVDLPSVLNRKFIYNSFKQQQW